MSEERRPQLGDFLYFREAQTGIRKESKRVKFAGHAFGMWVGVVPHFHKEPKDLDIFSMMGSLGWLTFDDVGEFLGPEAGNKVVEMYVKKYSAPPPPTIESERAAGAIADAALVKAAELAEVPPSQILDAHGKPLE
jgi:hypothetical protein